MNRVEHNLVQGTAEWHEFRSSHYGASEASAMLNMSPYMTRTELLNYKKSGITKEVDSYTQKIFDNGHRVESLARPLAEHYIKDDLLTGVFSKGKLSASVDGITLDDSLVWECKQFNEVDFDKVLANELPEKHWPQCQQVLYVTGADELLFTISDGTVLNTAHMIVKPDKKQQKIIVDGWAQFDKDLETHEVKPVAVPVVADATESLPVLSVRVDGSIAIKSNIDKFGERLRQFIAETNDKPKTDQDFANLEKAVKVLKEAEEKLKAAEDQALSQTESIEALRSTVKMFAELSRTNRLQFEKIVKAEKENRKREILVNAQDEYKKACVAFEKTLNFPFIAPQVDFAGAMKNKKLLAAMEEAVSAELANAKVAALSLYDELLEKREWFDDAGKDHRFLFNDFNQLVYRDIESFKDAVNLRIANYKAEQAEKEAAAKEAQKIEKLVDDAQFETIEIKSPEYYIETVKTGPYPRSEEKVTISLREYDKLVEDSQVLMALVAGGVDEWEGYEAAMARVMIDGI